jgi:hypothetical protein
MASTFDQPDNRTRSEGDALNIDALAPEVDRAARVTASSWGGAIDPDDVVQDMWVKILRSKNTEPALLSYESPQRGKVLRTIARQVAQQESASYEAFSGNSYYSTDDVTRILSGRRSDGIPGSTSHVEEIDLRAGLEALADAYPWYAELIHSRYVASDLDLSTGSARKELTRARDELARLMNRAHNRASADYDGPGSRT